MKEAIREEFAFNQAPCRERVEAILSEVLQVVLRRDAHFPKTTTSKLQRAFANAMQKRCLFILKAAQISTTKIREAEEWKERTLKEAKEANDKLNELRREAGELAHSIAVMSRSLAAENGYPPAPQPMVQATKAGTGLPVGPGIYFVWTVAGVQYVGQSVKLNSRARLGHDRIREGDRLSWLEFPQHRLNFAEAFYIGILMPPRNFGARAAQPLETL